MKIKSKLENNMFQIEGSITYTHIRHIKLQYKMQNTHQTKITVCRHKRNITKYFLLQANEEMDL